MVRWTQHVPREKVIPSCPDSPHWPPSLSWALVQVKGQVAMVAGLAHNGSPFLVLFRTPLTG